LLEVGFKSNSTLQNWLVLYIMN